MVSCYSYRC